MLSIKINSTEFDFNYWKLKLCSIRIHIIPCVSAAMLIFKQILIILNICFNNCDKIIRRNYYKTMIIITPMYQCLVYLSNMLNLKDRHSESKISFENQYQKFNFSSFSYFLSSQIFDGRE